MKDRPERGAAGEGRVRRSTRECIEYQEKYVYPCEKGVALIGGNVRGNHCGHNADELVVGGVDAKAGEFPHMGVALIGGDVRSNQCGRNADELVVGGVDAKAGEFPHMGVILIGGDVRSNQCGRNADELVVGGVHAKERMSCSISYTVVARRDRDLDPTLDTGCGPHVDPDSNFECSDETNLKNLSLTPETLVPSPIFMRRSRPCPDPDIGSAFNFYLKALLNFIAL
ncbi:hypothetical protein EVAR_77643_1 [Eumeta japonica]|uniref:Uncharacterized protein n=1 Tax=Eumeta variegata TaxID=151549 RepID=A0A4C1T6Y0_EUMVA|nr:hypothetical protein EVAR_77643_1 [Eumeta japonica]